jgi:hypothetical protein
MGVKIEAELTSVTSYRPGVWNTMENYFIHRPMSFQVFVYFQISNVASYASIPKGI